MEGIELTQLRLAAGLSQKDLGERAGLGKGEVARVMINRYEKSATHKIPAWRIDALKKACGAENL